MSEGSVCLFGRYGRHHDHRGGIARLSGVALIAGFALVAGGTLTTRLALLALVASRTLAAGGTRRTCGAGHRDGRRRGRYIDYGGFVASDQSQRGQQCRNQYRTVHG
ncbi:MAG: hypothetical protein Q7U40_10625 [Desulfatirhabdiaceae bacterium]|nr:hypothetical protein [Desulfatirhabdiaceae bacterium]